VDCKKRGLPKEVVFYKGKKLEYLNLIFRCYHPGMIKKGEVEEFHVPNCEVKTYLKKN